MTRVFNRILYSILSLSVGRQVSHPLHLFMFLLIPSLSCSSEAIWAPEEIYPNEEAGIRAFLNELHRYPGYHLPVEYSNSIREEETTEDLLADGFLEGFQENRNLLSIDLKSGPSLEETWISYDELSGGIIVKVLREGSGDSFFVDNVDLARIPEPQRSFPVEVAPEGTSWVFLRIDGAPIGKSIQHFSLFDDQAKDPFYYHALFLETHERATVHVQVSDEHDAETSALLGLKSLDNGNLYAPANHLRLSQQEIKISGQARSGPPESFPWYAPGMRKGHYWLIPGSFIQTLPPGEWELYGTKGTEYEEYSLKLTLKPGEIKKVHANFERSLNLQELGWYAGDDHVHSEMNDSLDAENLYTFARATNTHILNILEMGNSTRTWYRQWGFGEDYRFEKNGYVLVPGIEDPRFRLGHAIGLNLNERIRMTDRYMLNALWADSVRESGGLYGHTHVGHQAFNINRDMTLLIPRGKSDFCSILQGFLGTKLYYDFLNLGYRLNVSAGSDFAYGSSIGIAKVYTKVDPDSDVAIADQWFSSLKNGRSFVSNGPGLFLDADSTGHGEVVSITPEDYTVDLNVTAHCNDRHTYPAELEIIFLGEVYESVTLDEGSSNIVHWSGTLEAPHGGWIAARLKTSAGAEAHTNPIYLNRDGFRTWNRDKAPILIEERLNTLDEIEAELALLESEVAEGNVWQFDYWKRRPVMESDSLRQRIESVRNEYMNLLDTLEEENKVIAE